jgi:integrase
MPGKQAKVVTPPMLKRMLRRVSHSSHPARDRAMILLSIKAGLRACEIAGLDWSMVLDAQGRVSGTIHVRDVIAKKRGGRRIPMHPDLRRALEQLAHTTEPVGPVSRRQRAPGSVRPIRQPLFRPSPDLFLDRLFRESPEMLVDRIGRSWKGGFRGRRPGNPLGVVAASSTTARNGASAR